jgi:hypothetical protein
MNNLIIIMLFALRSRSKLCGFLMTTLIELTSTAYGAHWSGLRCVMHDGNEDEILIFVLPIMHRIFKPRIYWKFSFDAINTLVQCWRIPVRNLEYFMLKQCLHGKQRRRVLHTWCCIHAFQANYIDILKACIPRGQDKYAASYPGANN